MKLPICQTCLRSGVFCHQCQQKINEGVITPLDIEVSKALVKLENSMPVLKTLDFYGTASVGNIVILQVSRKSLLELGANQAKIVKALSDALDKKVRFIEKTDKTKRVAEELLDPARVKGINKIWLPDGSSETIIRIAVEDQERLPAGCEQLQITLRDLIGGHVRINFE